ncbi:hypothetical protein [Streptomyces olivochromogenes]|uniref:hypothetical protein n=1 Tax=Streptomyces olivochromogenes TaxID=1963 RepID=UPI001F455019|nr:hypothetical protein [Streptomyces olivochromogenes]MCF3131564.1 hypothetical protein [Streptomyces olivochromogenes]
MNATTGRTPAEAASGSTKAGAPWQAHRPLLGDRLGGHDEPRPAKEQRSVMYTPVRADRDGWSDAG